MHPLPGVRGAGRGGEPPDEDMPLPQRPRSHGATAGPAHSSEAGSVGELTEDLTALPGAAGEQVEDLLAGWLRAGAAALSRLARGAVERMLARGLGPAAQLSLFTDAELAELADALAATTATADLLGRALVRDWWQRAEEGNEPGSGESGANTVESSAAERQSIPGPHPEPGSDPGTHRGTGARARHAQAPAARVGGNPGEPASSLLHEELARAPVRPLAPARALAYFRRLVPALAVDAAAFASDQLRRGLALAAATGRELLDRVREFLVGKTFHTGEISAEKILDAAGVTPASPGYAEMVVRTAALTAYHDGADEERRHPEVAPTFPAWQYLAKVRPTSRPWHAARNGNYYPAAVTFAQVRGEGPEDVCNCLCTFRPVPRDEWARLEAAGARFAEVSAAPTL